MRKTNHPNRQRGQSMIEYSIVVAALVTALLMPLPDGMAKQAGENAIEASERAMRDNYRGYSYAVSMSEYPDYRGPQGLGDLSDAAQEGGEMLLAEFKEFPIPIETGFGFEETITFGDITDFLGF